jgi:hypothetical protein
MSLIEEHAEEEILVDTGAKPSTANVTNFINAGLWEQGIGAHLMKNA